MAHSPVPCSTLKDPAVARELGSSRCPGRPPVLPSSSSEVSAAWSVALQGFELDQLARGRSPKSIANRLSTIGLLARWASAQGTEPGDVTKIIMKGYLVAQFKHRKGSGPVTLYYDCKVFFDWFAREWGVGSPMAGIPRPKAKARAVPVLRPAQLRNVLAACKDGRSPWFAARDTAMVWLLLESGLRRAELAAANVEDLDLKARTITVPKGKGGKSRIAVFGDDSAAALWRWTKRLGRTSGPLFVSAQGHRITPSGVGDILHRIGEAAGVQPLRPHMFRHAAAHYQLEDGAREGDLMETFGWSTSAMLRVYGAELKQERAIAAMRQHQVGKVLRGT